MKTDEEVHHLIEKWIPRCIAFIEDGGRGEIGKNILTADRNDVEARVGEKCQTCPTIMIERKRRRPDDRPKTITVEHIVPRTLGGNNVRDNLVAMCHDCNKCRNTTMTRLIPHHVSFRGRVLNSEERALIAKFIEWSIRTMHTPNSSRVDPLCTQIFDEAKLEGSATSKEKLSRRVTRKTALSKVSNKKSKTILSKSKHDSFSEILSLLIEIRDTQKAILEQLQKSLFRRLIDWLVTPFRLISRKILSRRKTSKSISTSKEKKIDTHPPEETFEEIIEQLLLEEGSISVSYLGIVLGKYQKRNNWDDVGSGALLVKHGMSKNFGLKNAIRKLMPDRVIITGEHPKEMISLVNEKETVEVKNNLEEPVQTILIEEGDNYPIDDSTNLDGIDIFRHECLRVINESMSPVTFSMKLAASISENGFEDMTGKEFARHCGIPNSWSLLKALQTHLSDSICVDGKGTAAIITPLQSQGNEIPIEDHGNEHVLNQVSTRVSIVENSKYPLITNLNSSSSGLRLPREPRVLAAILDWYVLNISKLTNFHELINGVKGSGFVSSSRSFPIANQIRKAVFPPGKGKSSELDWNDAPHYDARELCDNMMNVSLGKSKWIFVVEPEFLVDAEEYFTHVKEFL